MRSFKFINNIISFNMSNQFIEKIIECMDPYITETFTETPNSKISVHQQIDYQFLKYIKNNGKCVKIHSNLTGYILEAKKESQMFYEIQNDNILVDYTNFNDIKVYVDNMTEIVISEIVKIVRFLFLYPIENKQDYIRAHCAVFNYKNKGILLIGNRGSGKTSFLLNSLKSNDINFVTNDKALIHNSGKIFGLPYAVSLPKISMKDIPEINRISTRTTILNKYLYWPKEFCDFFSTNIITDCFIDYIFLTNINFSNENIEIKRYDYDIAKIIFSDVDKNSPYWIGESFNGEKSIQFKEGFEHVFENNCYEIHGNPWRFDFLSQIDYLIKKSNLN